MSEPVSYDRKIRFSDSDSQVLDRAGRFHLAEPDANPLVAAGPEVSVEVPGGRLLPAGPNSSDR